MPHLSITCWPTERSSCSGQWPGDRAQRPCVYLPDEHHFVQAALYFADKVRVDAADNSDVVIKSLYSKLARRLRSHLHRHARLDWRADVFFRDAVAP